MQGNSRNTDDSRQFRYETFINSLSFSFLTRGEGVTIFTILTVPTQSFSQLCSWLPGPESKSQLASPRVKSQLTDATNALRIPQPPAGLASPRFKYQQTAFFKNHQNSQPITSGHDVIHTTIPFPIWGFYYDICDCHILRALASAPALRAEQFKA